MGSSGSAMSENRTPQFLHRKMRGITTGPLSLTFPFKGGKAYRFRFVTCPAFDSGGRILESLAWQVKLCFSPQTARVQTCARQ